MLSEIDTIILTYNLIMLALIAAAQAVLWRSERRRYGLGALVSSLLIAGCGLAGCGLAGTRLTPLTRFGQMQLLAWSVFVHAPVFLAATSLLLFKHKFVWACGCAGLALAIWLVGIEAFWIEPRWLDVTHVMLHTDKLSAPLRLAVVADVQTDAPGRYEADVFQRLKDERPDLILWTGDYIHVNHSDDYAPAARTLNALLRAADLQAELGSYAIQGNVDRNAGWKTVFADTPVVLIESTSSLDLGPLVLTALGLRDSFDVSLSLTAQEKFHVVMGHSPNFSLGQVSADVLIAGHTHGGQVHLPFLGPLLTLSAVPRAWAAGVTEIAPGRTLLVSRGVGLERGPAPRLRFLCRPQLVIVDLLPQ